MSDLEAILETGGAAAVELAASALAERGGKVVACPNCGAPIIARYCAVCGQERDTHRRSVLGLAHDLFEDIASFDSRVLRTATALFAKPGEIPLAFRQGRTRRYMPAVRLYLFVSLIFFLVLSATGLALLQLEVVATPAKVFRDAKGNTFIINRDYVPSDPDMPRLIPISKAKANQPGGPYTFNTKVHFFSVIGAYHSTLPAGARERLAKANFDFDDNGAKGKRKPTPEEKDWAAKHIFGGIQRLSADPAAMNGPLTTWIPRALFLLMPLYALLLAAFYWRQRKDFYFVDHLVFSLNIHTVGFVLLMLAAGAAQIFSGGLVVWGTLLVATVYGVLAFKTFYAQNWFWTGLKFAAVSFFYVLFCVLPAVGLVVAVSFLNV
jgi:uncharacterized protein DUF3667